MIFCKPTRATPRDTLEQLRLALHRLDRTGNLTAPSQADLRRILVARIADLDDGLIVVLSDLSNHLINSG